jgi:Uri superfamily endonuclease
VTDRGTYSLVLEVAEPATIEVGALGDRDFAPGWYAYAGSARGPGGFARLDRHRELAAGDRDVRHWHLDYVLGHEAVSVDAAFRTAGVDGECTVAATVDGEPVPGFGCSDCDCPSHFHHHAQRDAALAAAAEAHAALEERAR